MNNYYFDLEVNILSCLLQRPELMKNSKLEDKHFIKHQQLWKFMQSFYKKFQTFDIVLMANVCKNKYSLIKYISMLLDVEPAPSNFELYQQQLIELYNKNELEKNATNKIYDLANDLYVGNIDIYTFSSRVTTILKDFSKN